MAVNQHQPASPSEETPLVVRPASDDGAKQSISVARGTAVTVFVGFLLFIQAANMSVMTTAQSDIATDLDAFDEVTWFTSAYLIPMSSMTPLAGRLSQIFTTRSYILFSCTLLSAGLFITAAAPTLATFLLGRAVSGCGSGGLMSTCIIVVLDLASKKRRGLFVGLINAGITTGVSSGAVLAGLVAPVFGWRILFWFQAFLSLALGPMLYMAIPGRLHGSDARSMLQKLADVDYSGALTLTLSVVLLLFSLASSDIMIIPIALSFVSFGLFFVIESKAASEPIIPPTVLKLRSVSCTCIAGLGLMISRWAVLFFSPVYAIAVRGWGPASAGLILVPTNAGFGLGGLLVGLFHIRRAESYYASCLVTFLCFVSTMIGLSFLSTPSSPTVAYLCITFLNGLSAGAVMNYTLSHVLHLTSSHVQYIVTSLVAMSRAFAGSFGSAAGGGLFSRELAKALENGFSKHQLFGRDELIRRLLGSPALVMTLDGLEREIAIDSYEKAVRRLFVAGGLLALAMAVVQAGTGWKRQKMADHDTTAE